MTTALVLSAGGMWTAWEVGAWRVLRERFEPDLIVGASAGAWIGWAIAAGCTPEVLIDLWLAPRIGGIMRFGVHRTGIPRLPGDHVRVVFTYPTAGARCAAPSAPRGGFGAVD